MGWKGGSDKEATDEERERAGGMDETAPVVVVEVEEVVLERSAAGRTGKTTLPSAGVATPEADAGRGGASSKSTAKAVKAASSSFSG